MSNRKIFNQLYWHFPLFMSTQNNLTLMYMLLLLLLFYVWQSPGLPGWRKVNLITVTHRPHHPSIAAGLYCLTTSPGLLPALCEKWSGFFYVHRVLLSYTRDRRLKVSSERLGNEDKAPCPRTLLPGWGSNRGPPGWTSEVLTARPRQLLLHVCFHPNACNFDFVHYNLIFHVIFYLFSPWFYCGGRAWRSEARGRG